LAKQLNLPRTAITLRSGANARLKILRIEGEGAGLEAGLLALTGSR